LNDLVLPLADRVVVAHPPQVKWIAEAWVKSDRHDLVTIDQIDQHLQEIDQELNHLSTTDPWIDQVPFLLQLPGFGIIVSMTVLAAIGDKVAFKCVMWSWIVDEAKRSGLNTRHRLVTIS
jgi:hypothetical protein